VAGRRLLTGAYLLTFLTGAAGLIYQIAWQKYLARLLGSDSLATATVLGVFLAGLSLGYFVCGRLTVRTKHLFGTYGMLEGVIGVWGIGFPLLFRIVEAATRGWPTPSPGGRVLLGTLVGVVLMGLPTLCMGGTVPMLTRGLSRSLDEATRVHARIYGINTAGAFLGALAAGFVLIRWIGLPATVRGAALINLAAAGFFVSYGPRLAAALAGGALDPPATRRPSRKKPRADVTQGSPPVAWALYAIAFLSGLYFMTLESLLVRITNLSLGSSSYSLALVVAVFVLAVAAGAFWVSRRSSISPSALWLNQTVIAVGLMALFVTLDKWPYAAHLLRIRLPHTLAGFAGFQLAAFCGLLLVLALPVGFMGATLPLVFHALKRNLADVGYRAGVLFAWNAAGNFLGGIVGGFLIFRFLFNGEVFLFALALNVVTVGLASSWLPRRRRLAAAALAVVTLVFIWALPFHDATRFTAGTFRLREPLEYSYDGAETFYREYYRGRTILVYRDDPEGTFAVVENRTPAEALAESFPGLAASVMNNPFLEQRGARPRSVMVNGKSDSSTWFDRHTLKLLAHLPGLLMERRARVMIVGLGTGVTAGEFALYPDVRSIEVAEISPAVAGFLPWFEDSTGQVQEDPRLTIHIGDAFQVIGRSRLRWDIIVSEPSNPWVNGVDQLFSREFYGMVREHLEPGGLFVQWLQRYATSDAIAGVVVDTLRSEFPHLRLFRAEGDDLLLASLEPLDDAAFDRVAELLQGNAALRESLAAIDVAGPEDLRALEQPELLERLSGKSDGKLETLDHPRIHYMSAQAHFLGNFLDDE